MLNALWTVSVCPELSVSEPAVKLTVPMVKLPPTTGWLPAAEFSVAV